MALLMRKRKISEIESIVARGARFARIFSANKSTTDLQKCAEKWHKLKLGGWAQKDQSKAWLSPCLPRQGPRRSAKIHVPAFYYLLAPPPALCPSTNHRAKYNDVLWTRASITSNFKGDLFGIQVWYVQPGPLKNWRASMIIFYHCTHVPTASLSQSPSFHIDDWLLVRLWDAEDNISDSGSWGGGAAVRWDCFVWNLSIDFTAVLMVMQVLITLID